MPANLERRAEKSERRQPDWSKASVIHLESTDDQHSQFTRPPSQSESLGQRLDVPSHEVSLATELDEIIDRLNQPCVLMTSSTHRSTAQMFEAMDRLDDFNTGPRAILSFDHHSDLERIDRPVVSGDLPSKSNVMAYVLKQKLVDAVAVFGTADLYTRDHGVGHEVVSATQLYSNEIPDREKFIAALRKTLAQWQSQGIQQLYTSVDLDCLRLPTQLYTGTDYNPVDQSPYHGLPASWIPLAMQIAYREFGMTLGIQKQQSEQRVIGDVVEYVGPDYEGRTAKIAKGILGAMLAEAQAK